MSNPGQKRPRIDDGWNVYLEEHLSTFPIFVRRDRWLRRWSLPPHRQPGIEINITHVGRALLSVNDRVYPQLDRQVVAFSGACAHDFVVDGASLYTQTVICINESLLYTLLQPRETRMSQQILHEIQQGYFDFTITPAQWTQIDGLCLRLTQAFQQKTLWWEQVVSGGMAELVGMLFQSDDLSTTERVHVAADWMEQCQLYVERNLDQKLTLDEVAHRFYVSPEHLTRTFHKMHGMPFQRYVQLLRIKAACRLLVHEKSSIAEITCAVGFQSRSHFHRAFREVMGITPNDYRRSVGRQS